MAAVGFRSSFNGSLDLGLGVSLFIFDALFDSLVDSFFDLLLRLLKSEVGSVMLGHRDAQGHLSDLPGLFMLLNFLGCFGGGCGFCTFDSSHFSLTHSGNDVRFYAFLSGSLNRGLPVLGVL